MEAEWMVQVVLEKAVSQNVSDIHLMPEGPVYHCYFRRNGQLEKERSFSGEEGRRFISYLKFLGNMDVGEKRRPQSGSATLSVDHLPQDLRFSTITNFKQEESMVIRLMSKAGQVNLEQQSFFRNDVAKLKQLVRYKSGLLLFSGAVGSGKTTTMYHLVRDFATEDQQNVITVEDPVEVEEPAFLQCEVNEQAGIYYETLLKSSLRHHPDILIVGEIRDEETARMVIRGALTGHLILATVHAKHAEGVLERLMELGISRTLLKQTVLGIVFQKLMPQHCVFCEEECSKYCDHLNVTFKRAALFDIWEGVHLSELLLKERNASTLSSVQSFNQQLRKAWAYGYITDRTHGKFFIP